MLRSTLPISSPAGRAIPSVSSPSSSGIKAKDHSQHQPLFLQRLQRQEQHSRQQQTGKASDSSGLTPSTTPHTASSTTSSVKSALTAVHTGDWEQNNGGHDDREEEEEDLDQDQDHSAWISQEMKEAWIRVIDDDKNKDSKTTSYPQDRRHSHLSDRYLNAGPTKLLSDETPPDDMDGSWGLASLDDHDEEPSSTPAYTRTSPTDTPRHAHFHPQDDIDRRSNSSFRSTHVRNSPPTRSSADNAKFPWRDSKLDNIFSNIVGDTEHADQLQDHDGKYTSRGSNQQDGNGSQEDASSSVDYGDMIKVANQSNGSVDLERRSSAKPVASQSKYEQARRRLAELSPARDLQASPLDIPSPAVESAAGRLFQTDQESFKKQQAAIIKAGMNLDPTDRRSLAPPSTGQRKNTSAPPLSKLNTHTKLPRLSSVLRHRSQGSMNGEAGDRASTTSRDSAYRDSLSGSTLGSAGYQAQLDGVHKLELAHVFTALRAGIIDEHLESKQNNIRILPHDVNSRSKSSMNQIDLDGMTDGIVQRPSTTDLMSSEDTDATPRPNDRRQILLPHGRGRLGAESDQAQSRKYAALASKGLTKQTSSFVEVLANATDSALKSGSSPPSKGSEQTLVTESRHSPSGTRKLSAIPSPTEQARKREVTFDAPFSSTLERSVEEDDNELGLDDLGSLAGSKGMENAFKSLENLDLSFDMNEFEDDDQEEIMETKYKAKRRSQTDDEGADDYLSAVSLPSKPKRKGEHSLKWEAQLETASNADSSRAGISVSLSHSSSNPNLHNASMMPENSSFSHAEGELIRYITGLHPWDEWDQVKSLDLTNREVESTIKLNHLVPNLEVLVLNDNQARHLTGVPKSVKTLQARSNLLSDLTSFSHLSNLQYLDISHNGIEDLTGLSTLVHLRELMAEGNSIKSVSALQQMDGLIRLDVSHNCLTSLDFQWSKLQRLEFLNASHNQIAQLDNLESLVGLIHTNLAHNCIEDISLVQPLRRLRILRLSENKLLRFDANSFPGLRTLYLDDNRLHTLENCQTLTRLENFSARDQEGEGIAIDMTEFINSRKLYLSGNPIHALDFNMGFFRLEYLEICAGCLSELPLDFATLFPNLRGLNLSYNGLDSIAALDGLHRLRRLVFVGNNLRSFTDVLSLVKRMRSLVTLDLRHNPLTSNMYPVMSIKQGSKYQDTYRTNQNSETELDWRRRDAGFRRALPDAMYVKRSVYRSALLKSCKRLEWFDGGAIQDKERQRVPIVLGDLLDSYGRDFLTRREDDEEDFEFEEYGADYYYGTPQEEYAYATRPNDPLYNQDQLEQLNDDGQQDDGEEGVEVDERDPEDISDHSKRQTTNSSLGSGSQNGQRYLRQQQQQPHFTLSQQHALGPKSPMARGGRLRSRSGSFHQQNYQPQPMTSPSPKGTGPTFAAPVMLTPSKSARSGTIRMNSSSTLASHHLRNGGASAAPSSPRHTDTPRSRRRTLSRQNDLEEQEHQFVDMNVQGGQDELEADGSEKRSAVKTWRDEVNEVSLKKMQSPRTPSASQILTLSSHTKASSRGNSKSGGSSRSSGSVRNGSGSRTMGQQEAAGMSSTAGVANNSGERDVHHRPTSERRTSGRKFSIPPPPAAYLQQHAHAHQTPLRMVPSSSAPVSKRNSWHSRGRSDSAAALMLAAATANTHLNRTGSFQHPQQRPISGSSGSGMLVSSPLTIQDGAGFLNSTPMRSNTLPHPHPTVAAGLQHQLSMSPMGMTSSGTLLRPTHLRRRSLAAYPPPQHTAHGGSPGMVIAPLTAMSLSASLQPPPPPQQKGQPLTAPLSMGSPAASPGYFGLSHHQHSHLYTGGVVSGGGAAQQRSMPNTPSKGGRSSRVSQQGQGQGQGMSGSLYQTLARDMERSEAGN